MFAVTGDVRYQLIAKAFSAKRESCGVAVGYQLLFYMLFPLL